MNNAAFILSKYKIWPEYKLYGILTGIALLWPYVDTNEQNWLNNTAIKYFEQLTNYKFINEDGNSITQQLNNSL